MNRRKYLTSRHARHLIAGTAILAVTATAAFSIGWTAACNTTLLVLAGHLTAHLLSFGVSDTGNNRAPTTGRPSLSALSLARSWKAVDSLLYGLVQWLKTTVLISGMILLAAFYFWDDLTAGSQLPAPEVLADLARQLLVYVAGISLFAVVTANVLDTLRQETAPGEAAPASSPQIGTSCGE